LSASDASKTIVLIRPRDTPPPNRHTCLLTIKRLGRILQPHRTEWALADGPNGRPAPPPLPQSTKSGIFGDRKPYPGWIAFVFFWPRPVFSRYSARPENNQPSRADSYPQGKTRRYARRYPPSPHCFAPLVRVRIHRHTRRTPMACAVPFTRQAISPRFAINIVFKHQALISIKVKRSHISFICRLNRRVRWKYASVRRAPRPVVQTLNSAPCAATNSASYLVEPSGPAGLGPVFNHTAGCCPIPISAIFRDGPLRGRASPPAP